MRVIVIDNLIYNKLINNNNNNNNITNILPLTLIDKRDVIGADILEDNIIYEKYFKDLLNSPVIDIDELLIPENQLRWLLKRDNLGPLMPEDVERYKKIYEKEL